MSDEKLFPSLNDWESTRSTLHLYSRAIGAIPNVHAEFHPKWWHVSLEVQEDGLATIKMNLPEGGKFWFKIDLRQHKALLIVDNTVHRAFDLAAGLTGTEFGDQIIEAVAELGLTGEYPRDKFEDDEPREYDPVAATRFFTALSNADHIFNEYRATLDGELSPVQFWTHGFDLAFEWFGTRVETYEHEGEVQHHPSQINLGFYPGGSDKTTYFYSNPWPFEADQLLDQALPNGCSWHTDGWQGSILPYEELSGDAEARSRLSEYARTVFEVSSPTLLV
jgi:hypothetical protein